MKIKLGRTPGDTDLPKFMISVYRRPESMKKFWCHVGPAYAAYWCIMGFYRDIHFDLWYYHTPRR